MKALIIFLSFFFLGSSLIAQEELHAQLQKGIAAFGKNDYIKAERIFDKLLKQEESYADAYLWKGKCLQEFEEYQAAYTAMSTAKNLVPDHAPYWVEIGNLKYNLGITSIRKPEICGECGTFLLPETGEMLKAPDYFKSAIKDYIKATQLAPQYADAYYQMALSYEGLGNSSEACEQLQNAKQLKHIDASLRSKKKCP